MAKVQAFVWHDRDGAITAVGRIAAGVKEKIEPLVHGDRRVLRLSVEEKHLQTLHATHRVDVENGTLAPRPAAGMNSPQPKRRKR